jgi:hypothetical protein
MSRSQASQHIGLMARRGNETNVLSSPNNLVSDIYVCPQCWQEDLATFGDFAFYRSHHMPGVTVCHKHGCSLRKYDEGKDVDQYTILEEKANALTYANFCHDMLHSGIQCDFLSIKKLVPSIHLATYINQEEVLFQLMQKYGSVDVIKANLVTISQKTEFEQIASERFSLISPWREDIIALKCNICGREFISSPYRVISGWGCPQCDCVFTNDELFQRLFDAQNDGTYTLLSPFTGMSDYITVHHSICSKNQRIRARSFIIENTRCECEHMISEEQARASIEYSGEFKVEAFESTSIPVRIRHMVCGHTFSWNYHKFLQYPWCKICNPRIPTQETFIQEIENLVGDEYILEGEYVNRTSTVQIRHNRCGCVQTYRPSRFLDGARCSKCTTEYTKTELERVVREISLGKYLCVGPKTKNLETVKDTDTGVEKYMSQQRILQELMRPTPSPILPLKRRNLNIAMPTTQEKSLFTWLCNHYSQNDMIFLEDIQIDGLDYNIIKNAMQEFVESKKLKRIAPGIFSFHDTTFTPHETIIHKYMLRNGKRIGFLTNHSFAYDLGLSDEKPKRISIVTNKESQQHGRNRTFLGVDLKLHGSRIPVDDSNYAQLAVLTFVLSEKRLKCCTQGDKNNVLRQWLETKEITYSDFDDYYQYFPSWAKNIIAQIYGDK